MNVETRRVASEFYDATLVEIDEEAGVLVFNAAGTRHCVGYSGNVWWNAGAIGRLRLPDERFAFSFHPYPDQRLRRLPTEDDPRLDRKSVV